MIKEIVDKVLAGRSKGEIAYAFHMSLTVAFRRMAEIIREKAGLNRIVLSGGCFQNCILTESVITELEKAGFTVFFHEILPTNDGCISLGQAVCAGEQVRR